MKFKKASRAVYRPRSRSLYVIACPSVCHL